MIKAQTLKGFRDFLPAEEKKRQFVINTVKSVFERYGFEPLETPALEYEEILTGKYGDEGDKLMYKFEDLGKRKVALRYDQTVPLARVVAEYQNQLPFPFKRYQIQNVWRAENTQKGRYREFLQCDIDIAGCDSPLADSEIIETTIKAYQSLGFKNFKVLINDRQLFSGLSTEAVIAIDKLKKIGETGVCNELVEKNIAKNTEEAKNLLQKLLDQKPTEQLLKIFALLEQLELKKYIEFSPTLARGMNYYTGMIFEVETPDYPYGAIGSGGRYDNLIGIFTNNQIPAVGFAMGFDRTLEAMEALQLFPDYLATATTKVLVTIFSLELKSKSLEICSLLRSKNINTELYLNEEAKMDKQLKFANQRNIPFVVIIGPEEAEKNLVTVKNMRTREQKQISIDDLIAQLQQYSV